MKQDDTLAARVRELEAELEMYRDLAGKPRKCDPPGSGEELCNTACELAQRLAEVERQRDALSKAVDQDDEMIDTLRREKAEVERQLNETWVDENGTVWTRPTAWAYAQVCKARDKHQAAADTLQREVQALKARLEMEVLLDDIGSKLLVIFSVMVLAWAIKSSGY